MRIQLINKKKEMADVNNNYDICFLSILYPGNIPEYDALTQRHRAQNITAIQKSIIEGLESASNSKAWVINTLLVPLYRHGYKSPVVKQRPLSINGTQGVNYGYLNIRGMYASCLFPCAKKHIREWGMSATEKKKVLIAYSLTSYTLLAMQYAKSLNPEICTLIIVPDLPQYTYGFSMKPLIRVKNGLSKHKVLQDIKRSSRFVDGWIVFSQHMTEEIPNCKNYMVLESVFTDLFSEITPSRMFGRDSFEIIYAGGCNREYGLSLLMDAFSMMPQENARLVIFGRGNYTPQIEECAQKDSRVTYLGEIPREQLLAYQKGADLLVNPRINTGIFTRYSFPSKNMEYMSSGTPMVGHKLEGIPDEYDDYINYFAEPNAESLASCMVNLYNNYEAASVKAAEAQEYVSKTKNKNVWGQKILQFVEQI